MKILVTGSAGFIGSRVSELLIEQGNEVLGVDSLNEAYDSRLKEWRLAKLKRLDRYEFSMTNIVDYKSAEECFSKNNIDGVINLAAQAGVRYSIENPLAYIDSNIVGFAHILEGCRNFGVENQIRVSNSRICR